MVDVLIVGQGVAGSVLAHKLINLKKDIRIIDPVKPAFLSAGKESPGWIIGYVPGNWRIDYSDHR